MELNAEKLMGAVLSAAGSMSGGGAAPDGTGGGGTGNLPDLSALAKAIQETKVLDAEKVSSLKTELVNAVKGADLSGAAKLKLAPVLTALKSSQGNTPEQDQKLWDILRPVMGDAANLSGLLSMLGEHSGTILSMLKKFFQPS